MIKTQALSFLLASWALYSHPVVGAWHPNQRDCRDSYLCLQSFIWCDTKSASAGGGGCHYPEGVYPPTSTGGGTSIYALVMEDHDYDLAWKVDGRVRDRPVEVRWQLGDRVRWNVSTTEARVVFNPGAILRSLPDADRAEAMRAAYHDQVNVLRISQPTVTKSEMAPNNPGTEMPVDMSSQFTVGDRILERFFAAQREMSARDEYDRWKLGVGVGVGLGVPLLLAGTALVTWSVAKKRTGRNHVIAPGKP